MIVRDSGLIPAKRDVMNKITVMIVDDSADVTDGLRGILKPHEDLEVVGDATDGEAAIAIAQELQPSVILMDAELPGCDCVEITRCLKRNLPATKVIFMAIHPSHIDAAIEAGADRLLMKDSSRHELIETIRELGEIDH